MSLKIYLLVHDVNIMIRVIINNTTSFIWSFKITCKIYGNYGLAF